MSRNKSIFLASAVLSCLLVGIPASVDAAGVAHFQLARPVPPKSSSQTELDAINKAIAALKSAPLPTALNKKVMDDLNKSKFDAQRQIGIENAMLAATLPSDTNGGGTTGGVSIPPIPNSDINYLDDHLEWQTPIHVQATTSSGGVDLTTSYCLPAKNRVVGMASSYTPGAKSNTNDGDALAVSYLPVKLDTQGAFFGAFHGTDEPIVVKEQATDAHMCDGTDTGKSLTIADGTQFFVNADDLESASTRMGWDFGTLVVPFKVQLSDKTAFTSSATLGGYLGYRLPLNLIGFQFRPVIFAGVSEVPTSQTDSSGITTSQTVAGLSYGFGFITTIKEKFNVGLIVGADHVTSVQPYAYQDKPWISLELGVSFTTLAK